MLGWSVATTNCDSHELDLGCAVQGHSHEQCEVVVNERDILGTQLIRRNEELGLLYERIRIGESMLLKGESQYSARVKELEAQRHAPPRRERDQLRGESGSTTSSSPEQTSYPLCLGLY